VRAAERELSIGDGNGYSMVILGDRDGAANVQKKPVPTAVATLKSVWGQTSQPDGQATRNKVLMLLCSAVHDMPAQHFQDLGALRVGAL
jgi:hypothetical protein